MSPGFQGNANASITHHAHSWYWSLKLRSLLLYEWDVMWASAHLPQCSPQSYRVALWVTVTFLSARTKHLWPPLVNVLPTCVFFVFRTILKTCAWKIPAIYENQLNRFPLFRWSRWRPAGTIDPYHAHDWPIGSFDGRTGVRVFLLKWTLYWAYCSHHPFLFFIFKQQFLLRSHFWFCW